MEAVNLSSLTSDPGDALRRAQHDVVVVLSHDQPEVLMVGVEAAGGMDAKGVRPAMATALFRDGQLSLVRAARLAQMSAAEFAAHLSRLGVPLVRLSAQETEQDLDSLGEWLAPRSS